MAPARGHNHVRSRSARNLQCVIDLDAEISHGAFQFGMAKQELYGLRFLVRLHISASPWSAACYWYRETVKSSPMAVIH